MIRPYRHRFRLKTFWLIIPPAAAAIYGVTAWKKKTRVDAVTKYTLLLCRCGRIMRVRPHHNSRSIGVIAAQDAKAVLVRKIAT